MIVSRGDQYPHHPLRRKRTTQGRDVMGQQLLLFLRLACAWIATCQVCVQGGNYFIDTPGRSAELLGQGILEPGLGEGTEIDGGQVQHGGFDERGAAIGDQRAGLAPWHTLRNRHKETAAEYSGSL